MEYEGPFYYRLRLHGSEDKRVLTKKDLDGNATTFKDPVTQNKTPKIYILKQEEEVVYIGYASQSIGTRFGQGIRANGAKGYHGYKWKQEEELELFVFVFDHLLIGNKNKEDEPYVLLTEAVEAELVYLIREKTGKWPQFQNEIHFNNNNLPRAKEIALKMFNTIDSELPWYQPDSRWEIWGIDSKETFVVKFVVPGKFHSKVPRDIVAAFETVTYLMAHAYFYYPTYDEAMSKALLIMEMAIKLKAQELNIELKTPPNRKGDVYDKKLYKIIEEVCENEHLKFLEADFNRAKNLRNAKMHPKKHTIMGAMGFTNGNTMLFVNVINKLFLDKEELTYIDKTETRLKEKIENFRDGRYIVEYNNLKILAWKIYDLKYVRYKDQDLFMVYIGTVSKDLKKDIETYNYIPLVVPMSIFKMDDFGFSGIDVYGEPITFMENQDPNIIEKFNHFHQQKLNLSFSDLRFHIAQMENMVMWRYEELMYDNCWN
ncbi:hypothetical protein [Arenibacter palladensis]|uniref:hypothetical protein n=1 Tax=Arenibacter palladensis TaxID=237373 RepID=UPI0026E18526|nr:hypothetical protein [Arenibacter palladensis]MDO6605697.1 hypothetical protein [Arenibacter palladensis]